MSVYVRKDSSYYWLLLPRAGQKPLRLKTAIHVKAATPEQTRVHKRLADVAYYQHTQRLVRGELDLPTNDSPTITGFRATRYDTWLKTPQSERRRRHIARRRDPAQGRVKVTPSRQPTKICYFACSAVGRWIGWDTGPNVGSPFDVHLRDRVLGAVAEPHR